MPTHNFLTDNSPTSYDSVQRHVICDNQIWANRNKVMNFWGPEVTVEFTSDNRINGRGYMVTVNGKNATMRENRAQLHIITQCSHRDSYTRTLAQDRFSNGIYCKQYHCSTVHSTY